MSVISHPQPNPRARDLSPGEREYKIMKNCHKLGRDVTGPGVSHPGITFRTVFY